jgi:hypothetical protein
MMTGHEKKMQRAISDEAADKLLAAIDAIDDEREANGGEDLSILAADYWAASGVEAQRIEPNARSVQIRAVRIDLSSRSIVPFVEAGLRFAATRKRADALRPTSTGRASEPSRERGRDLLASDDGRVSVVVAVGARGAVEVPLELRVTVEATETSVVIGRWTLTLDGDRAADGKPWGPIVLAWTGSTWTGTAEVSAPVATPDCRPVLDVLVRTSERPSGGSGA